MTTLTFIKLKDNWRADNFSDPPIGILSVIASARRIKHNGKSLEVKLCDMAYETEIPPSDVYGISACSLDYPELLNIANRIKQQNSGRIIVGGCHFESFNEDYWKREMQELPIDLICLGEGEGSVKTAIESFGDNSKRVIVQNELLNLDSLDMPAWDILDKTRYFRNGSGTAMTSRGCYGICSFCASPAIHKHKVRFRSIENVEKEIDYLKSNYGINFIRFQDDCFSLGKERFKKLTEMIATKEITYRVSLRTDQCNEETLKLLRMSGCTEAGFGIESASQKVLDLLHKRTTVEQNKRALMLTKSMGLKTRVFCMTALPGENSYSAQEMIDFLEETKPNTVTLTSFTPLPGSDIFNNPSKYGIEIVEKDWAKYDISLKFAPKAPFIHRLSTLTLEDMEKNRELLKSYVFNTGISNVSIYNKHYEGKK